MAARDDTGKLATDGSGIDSILVMSGAGVFTVPLPAAGAVSIGRSLDCAVRIDDPLVSRVHALIHLGDRCELEDLGGANGTSIGGRRVPAKARVPVSPGDLIHVGKTVLVLQASALRGPNLAIASRAAFEARLSSVLARGGALGLVRVAIGADMAVARSTTLRRSTAFADELERTQAFERTLAESMRPGDLLASHPAGGYEMLLVDVAAASAAHTVSLLRTRLEEGGFPVALGLACAPRDGREPTALRACCETGLRSSEPEAPAEAQFDRGIIQRLSATIERVASSSLTVLILGETGVGKEVMARTLHERSSRRDAPMVSLNCAAFSEQLIESELFGHERGAFTGATQQKVGLLESARGGTVFLDELAEMPLSLQAKLLRVLEAREVLRVGSLRPRPIDVRFIAATNRDLSAEVAAGRFRQDLFFRVNGVTLVIPPLRDRPGEIEPLARAFLAQACAQAGRARVPTFSSSALDLLRSHQWPGNIRELRNLIERAVLLCDGDVIGVEHCTDRLSSLSSASLRSAPPVHGPAEASVAGATGAGARTIVPPDAREGASDERRRLLDALERCAGNQTHAARLLGISRRTLIHRIEAFDIPRPRKRDDAP